MKFDDIWKELHPNILVTKCGGIRGVEEDGSLRTIYMNVQGYFRIWLNPDGTYRLDVPMSEDDAKKRMML